MMFLNNYLDNTYTWFIKMVDYENTLTSYKLLFKFLFYLFVVLTFYFYLTAELVYYLVGFYYPLYLSYCILEFPAKYKKYKLKIMLEYLIIYEHMELFNMIMKYLMLPSFIYLRTILIILLLYASLYDPANLHKIYNKLIFNDKVCLKVILVFYLKLKNELKKVIQDVSDKN